MENILQMIKEVESIRLLLYNILDIITESGQIYHFCE